MNPYTAQLEAAYAAQTQDKPCSRLEWLAKDVFQFGYYSSKAGEMVARKALIICDAIVKGTLKDYVKDRDNRFWLFEVSLSYNDFFIQEIKTLETGTERQTQDSKTIVGITVERSQWHCFLRALLDFAKTE